MTPKEILLSLAIASSVSLSGSAFAELDQDFGQQVEWLARAQSVKLFGVIKPLDDSSMISLSAAAANANPAKLVTLARGLTAKVISADPNLGPRSAPLRSCALRSVIPRVAVN